MDLTQGRNFIVNVVVGVVGAMIAILIYTPINGINMVTTTGKRLANYTKKITGMVKTTAMESLEMVRETIKTCKSAAVETVSKMAAATRMAIEWMAASALKLSKAFGVFYREAVDKVETVIDLIQRTLQRIMENASRIAKMTVEKAKSLTESVLENLKEAPKALKRFVTKTVVPAIRKKINMTKKMAESVGNFISRYLPMYLRALKYTIEYSLKIQLGSITVHLAAVVMSLFMTLGQKFVGLVTGADILGKVGDIISGMFGSIVSDYNSLQSKVCNSVVDLVLSTGFTLPPIPLFGSNMADCTASWIKTGIWISSRGLFCKQRNPTAPIEFVRCLLGTIGDLEIIPYIPRIKLGPSAIFDELDLDLGLLGELLDDLPGQITVGPFGPYTINNVLTSIETKIITYIEKVQAHVWKGFEDSLKEGNKAFSGVMFALTGVYPESDVRKKVNRYIRQFQGYLLSYSTLINLNLEAIVLKYNLIEFEDRIYTYATELFNSGLYGKIGFDEIIQDQAQLNAKYLSILTPAPKPLYTYSLDNISSNMKLVTIPPVVCTYTSVVSKITITLSVTNPGYFVNEYVRLEQIEGTIGTVVAKIILVNNNILEIEYNGSVIESSQPGRLSPISLYGEYKQLSRNFIVNITNTNRKHGYITGNKVVLNFISGRDYIELSGTISDVTDPYTLSVRTTLSPPVSDVVGIVSISPQSGQINKEVLYFDNHRLGNDIPLVIRIDGGEYETTCYRLDANRLEVSINPSKDSYSEVQVAFSPKSNFGKYPTSIIFFPGHGYLSSKKAVYINGVYYDIYVVTQDYIEINESIIFEVGHGYINGDELVISGVGYVISVIDSDSYRIDKKVIPNTDISGLVLLSLLPAIPDGESGIDRLGFNNILFSRKLGENIGEHFPDKSFSVIETRNMINYLKAVFYGIVFQNLLSDNNGDNTKFINSLLSLIDTNPSNNVTEDPLVRTKLLELRTSLIGWLETFENDPGNILRLVIDDFARETESVYQQPAPPSVPKIVTTLTGTGDVSLIDINLPVAEGISNGLVSIVNSMEGFTQLKFALSTTDFENKPKGTPGVGMIVDIMVSLISKLVEIIRDLVVSIINTAVDEAVSTLSDLPGLSICIGVELPKVGCKGYKISMDPVTVEEMGNAYKAVFRAILVDGGDAFIKGVQPLVDLYVAPARIYAKAVDNSFPSLKSSL